MSYEDRKSTWNSGVWKAIRPGSAEEEVRKHWNRVTGAWKQIKESQVAMQEAQIIGKRAQSANDTSSLHLHQQICASPKDTMDARRELDDHTSTLHVGSKIRLHGLLNQTLNGKKGIVLGTASNNRIGIQLQVRSNK